MNECTAQLGINYVDYLTLHVSQTIPLTLLKKFLEGVI